MEGAIAKGLADFASRELLENMMKSLREFLANEGIRFHEISFNPAGTRLLVQIYSQISKELMPGGGVRGVVTYVKRYDPSSEWIGKSVLVVVDLTIVALALPGRIGNWSLTSLQQRLVKTGGRLARDTIRSSTKRALG
jgi:hypothetical protein